MKAEAPLRPRILASSKRVRWSGPIRPERSSTGRRFFEGPGLSWPAVARTPLTTFALGTFFAGVGLGAFGAFTTLDALGFFT